jgi:NADPH:quinone reductase-like Zn-dependent oxidoreductase
MAQPNAAQLAEIAELIDSGRVRPFVAATFPWKEARSAEDHQQHGHNRGKIVLEVAAAA